MRLKRLMFVGKKVIFAVVGDRAAVHFWVLPNYDNESESRGGVEFHIQPTRDEQPDHAHCWLLGKPCFHYGSSLYAEEKLIPLFHFCAHKGEYDAVWRELENALYAEIGE